MAHDIFDEMHKMQQAYIRRTGVRAKLNKLTTRELCLIGSAIIPRTSADTIFKGYTRFEIIAELCEFHTRDIVRLIGE